MKVNLGIQRAIFSSMSNHPLQFYLRFPYVIYPQKRILKFKLTCLAVVTRGKLEGRAQSQTRKLRGSSLPQNLLQIGPLQHRVKSLKSQLVYAGNFERFVSPVGPCDKIARENGLCPLKEDFAFRRVSSPTTKYNYTNLIAEFIVISRIFPGRTISPKFDPI